MLYAELDSLTGIYNRRKITEIFNHIIEVPEKYNIILFDIDDFKKQNDAYGHTVGDEVLRVISDLIRSNYPDLPFARWGGEEFILMLHEKNVGEEIRELVMNHLFVNNISLTISLGQTMIEGNDNITTATRRADETMYESKNSGKNKLTIR